MTPNDQKAVELMRGVANTDFPSYVAALSAAGLIVTDLHERSVELANAYIAWRSKPSHDRDSQRRLDAAESAILAAKKPKERWTVEAVNLGPQYLTEWLVYEDDRAMWSKAGRRAVATFHAEPEARAYVARKNAEEGK